MGTVTKFTACSTSSMAIFNMYLDADSNFGMNDN